LLALGMLKLTSRMFDAVWCCGLMGKRCWAGVVVQR
jgi:hypothetical protein